ncbi:Ribosomal protein S18 acetylase RimI [Abditibacterium utsteinense]|uniref:Ribosomal protein S18 acetylase RimI n=1 Tax=Abditibacterium utsteinense TaxID=1960156 RepID=A0A2S8SUS0_9BACT|nr:GNAT family N-acetyltransferase [Abditibacterium utsteinense]PQV64548.1 Ribosomal protein S18 acetylase RimI [Abditibacterium utsteinense]
MVFPFSLTAQGAVRVARAADLPHLEWHGGADLRSFYEATWQSHQSGESTLLVADLGGFPIGQIVVLWRGKPSHPHFPDLQSLRVHPAFRGLGVGSRLIEAAEKLCAERDYSKVGLSVGLDNPRARQLYEKLGYQSQEIIYDEEWSYLDQNGREIHVVERVLDLAKPLRNE